MMEPPGKPGPSIFSTKPTKTNPYATKACIDFALPKCLQLVDARKGGDEETRVRAWPFAQALAPLCPSAWKGAKKKTPPSAKKSESGMAVKASSGAISGKLRVLRLTRGKAGPPPGDQTRLKTSPPRPALPEGVAVVMVPTDS